MSVVKVAHPVVEYQWIDEADYDATIHTLIESDSEPEIIAQAEPQTEQPSVTPPLTDTTLPKKSK